MTDAPFHQERASLKTLRDELRLQIHLAGAELRDTFEELDRDWHRVEGQLSAMTATASDDAADVKEAASLLLDELAEGFKHLRGRLQGATSSHQR